MSRRSSAPTPALRLSLPLLPARWFVLLVPHAETETVGRLSEKKTKQCLLTATHVFLYLLGNNVLPNRSIRRDRFNTQCQTTVYWYVSASYQTSSKPGEATRVVEVDPIRSSRVKILFIFIR